MIRSRQAGTSPALPSRTSWPGVSVSNLIRFSVRTGGRLDFIVRLAGGEARFLILEIKGYDPLTEVKAQAAERWVRAVNADGGFGVWGYALVSDVGQVGEAVGRAV